MKAKPFAFMMFAFMIGVGLFLALTLVWTVSAQGGDPITLNINLGSEPLTLDPALATDTTSNSVWTLAKMDNLSTGRLLSRVGEKPFYRFQQEVIPCSPVFYTLLRNYAHSSTG